ncbi:MAG: NDP-hexose 2,3-dehydratase family protein [Bacteroidetes bacterium]|nr:NDP-hexose 2,3-dehydratase family protein [Bacteroidota bacterium]
MNRIAFNDLKQWSFDPLTSNLSHTSGKFFSIEGISIQINFGLVNTWDQPIIISLK